MNPYERIDIAYDARRNPIRTTRSSGGNTYTVSDASFDDNGRPVCQTIRMNPAVFNSLPASACSLSTTGSNGPDRVTRNSYDYAGQLLKTEKAVGTSLQQNYVAYTYTINGKKATITDANGNVASMTYDGHDRQLKWNMPSKTSTGQVSATDYESYEYDASGNRVSLRKRDGRAIAFTYDALGRAMSKTFPNGGARGVYYSYDLRGLQTAARFDNPTGADAVVESWDPLGRRSSSTTSMAGFSRTLSFQYDEAGNRTRVTWPDGNYLSYQYDSASRFRTLSLNGATQVAQQSYNVRGLIASRVSGLTKSYGYDEVGRLSSQASALVNGVGDITTTLGWNAANQIVSRTRSNDAYAFSGYFNVNRSYSTNGLNQYATAGSASFTYDANGNLTSDGTVSYIYDIENRLVSSSNGAALTYDPLGRIFAIARNGSGTHFLYDGDELSAEYDSAGGVIRHYAHGAEVDDPLIWWEGSGFAAGRSLAGDHQGSIVTVANLDGSLFGINGYDEYGIPNASNVGRFGYTGQAWLSELGFWYYKARMYSPTLGRFLQTDPIGYNDQINLYAYVENDPVNGKDPTGLAVQMANTCSRVGGSSCAGSYAGDGIIAAANATPPGQKSDTNGVRTPREDTRKLRRAWEAEHGEKWPKDPVTGRNQDLHHDKPLADGGTNKVENVRPMTRADHTEHHRQAGDFRRWGSRSGGGRALGIFGGLSMVTGIMSGRIRTDSLDNFVSDWIGVPSQQDLARMDIKRCGAPGCV
jgi:RHS repeat-associated protein